MSVIPTKGIRKAVISSGKYKSGVLSNLFTKNDIDNKNSVSTIIDVLRANLRLAFIISFGEYRFVDNPSEINLLHVIFKLKPDKLINRIIEGKANTYNDIPSVPNSLVIIILFISPNNFINAPLIIMSNVL